MKSEIPMLKYTCPKCGGRKYRLSEIRVAHSLFTQLFDIQSAKYTAIICEKCKYTEFYNVPVKKITGVTDFFLGG
jgi:predicted nucleic-acid-binding Zn-ribbon protein